MPIIARREANIPIMSNVVIYIRCPINLDIILLSANIQIEMITALIPASFKKKFVLIFIIVFSFFPEDYFIETYKGNTIETQKREFHTILWKSFVR